MTAKKKTATPKKTTTRTATPAAPPKSPTTSALAATLGVTMTPPLTPAQMRALLKALPGYVSLLDNVASQLDADAALLNLKGLTGAQLLQLQSQQQFLSARESVSDAVYRCIYEQRLQADSQAMGALYRINKRVEAMASEDPDLSARWGFLSAFMRKFRPGTKSSKAAAATNRAKKKAVKGALKKPAPAPAA